MTSSLFHIRAMSLALTVSVLTFGLAAEGRADDWGLIPNEGGWRGWRVGLGVGVEVFT